MNRFIRTAPTSRLLAVIAGIAIAAAAGTTLAIAAQGGGPVPPRKSLAVAIRQALATPAVRGISGRFSFTDNLLPSSEVQGSDPLLSGSSGRFWVTPDVVRIELQGNNGDANAVIRGRSFWLYDPASNTVYEGSLPSPRPDATRASHRMRSDGRRTVPTVRQIEAALRRLAEHLRLSGAIPGDVAGRPTYTVRVSPRSGGGLLGAAELAWDAVRGVPLRFALYARGDATPVLSLQVTGIHFGRISRSVFAIAPPGGAHVVRVSPPSGQSVPSGHSAPARESASRGGRGRRATVTGVSAVARRLTFTLLAPPRLVGLGRSSVSLVGTDAALVVYGPPLGGVAVLEQVARPGGAPLPTVRPSSGGDQPGLTLPTVAIGSVRAQELDTALGTVVRFARGGVQYTVLGSVRPAVAVAAARSL